MKPSIIGAVIERFDASTAQTPVSGSGGLWFAEIPSDKELPWACLWHLSEPSPELTMGAGYIERGKLQFEVYADTLESAETIARGIMDVFDPSQDSSGDTHYVSLSIQDATLVRFERSNYLETAGTQETPDNKTVYEAVIEYQYEVVRQAKVRN